MFLVLVPVPSEEGDKLMIRALTGLKLTQQRHSILVPHKPDENLNNVVREQAANPLT